MVNYTLYLRIDFFSKNIYIILLSYFQCSFIFRNQGEKFQIFSKILVIISIWTIGKVAICVHIFDILMNVSP